MSSVPEMIFVPRKVRSVMLCEAMPSEPGEMTGTPEMATTVAEMATTPKLAAAMSSTTRESSGGRERQNAGQNQAAK